MRLETKIERFTDPLYLESGRILEPYEIAMETIWEVNSSKSNGSINMSCFTWVSSRFWTISWGIKGWIGMGWTYLGDGKGPIGTTNKGIFGNILPEMLLGSMFWEATGANWSSVIYPLRIKPFLIKNFPGFTTLGRIFEVKKGAKKTRAFLKGIGRGGNNFWRFKKAKYGGGHQMGVGIAQGLLHIWGAKQFFPNFFRERLHFFGLWVYNFLRSTTLWGENAFI